MCIRDRISITTNNACFVNFRNQGSRHIAGQKVPDRFQQVRLAELVWKIRVSGQNLDSEIKFFKKGSENLVLCQNLAFRNSCVRVDFSKSVVSYGFGLTV